jgi:2,3-bisphosphoglycerate-independent phosphoglycerate mutase
MADGMKYVIIVGDGMADYPVESLGGKTPLMAARTPNMDWLARHGSTGLVRTVPEGFTPGSEIANLSIFGYDPVRYYTGRGPLEAASLNIVLEPEDLAFRCNLVTVQEDGQRAVMEDFSAGHITSEEAEGMIQDLNGLLGTSDLRFHAGVSYRHLMVWRRVMASFPVLETLPLAPPHDIVGKEIGPFLAPAGGACCGTAVEGGVEKIRDLTFRSQAFLKDHPVNRARKSRGVRPANSIWLWGQGRAPRMVTVKERFGIEGYVISAVHLLRGIGMLAGLEVMDVPGATGYFDTNYEGKATYALEGLRKRDLVYIHVEAPDEAGHMGDLKLKMESIEAFDEKVVGTVLGGIQEFKRYRVMVLPDHPTPLSVRTHVGDPVPFVIYSSEIPSGRDCAESFDEDSVRRSGIIVERGHELIDRFING